MMLIPSFKKLLTIIVLLCYDGITKSQASWLRSFCSRAVADDPTTTDKHISCFQRFYGPHLPHHDGCPKYELLDSRNIEATRKRIAQCTNISIDCDSAKSSKFRTIDGSCNNLNHPTWGMSYTCLRRILPFDYEDNVSEPRISCTGKPLPNARNVSNVLHSGSIMESPKFTTHFMEWGQAIAHDVTLNDLYKTAESDFNFPVECCDGGVEGGSPVSNDQCIAISTPPAETFYNKYGVTCLDFARTIPCQCRAGGQLIHSNKATSCIDLSIVYGSTEHSSTDLRSNSTGMLKVENNPVSGPLLPTSPIEIVCVSPPDDPGCYHSGDSRTNQNIFMLTVHTYLLRHHNFICQHLAEVNPQWDDEQLYQEARRINIAIGQWISYKYYLPHILGEAIMQEKGLAIPPGIYYTKYNPDVDPSIFDEFTVWAGRYGHTQIPGRISEIDPQTGKTNYSMVRDHYFAPYAFRCGLFDKIANGMTVDNPKKRDVSLSDDVRNYLYKIGNMTSGQDLAALSIVRGRDHGMPGYTSYLCYFGIKTVYKFDDLRGLMPDKSVDLLKTLYDSVHDIDVYSGAFAEYPCPGGLVGPTIAAVLTRQYKGLKFGDRYWFEHGNEAGSFTPNQLLEIKNSSLARILCETTNITKVQENVFFPRSKGNRMMSCKDIGITDFSPWRENRTQLQV